MNGLWSRKKTVIALAIAAVLILPLFVVALFTHPSNKSTQTTKQADNTSSTNSADTTPQATPTNSQVLQAVAEQKPDSGANTTSVIGITDLGYGWYSARMQRSASSENEQVLMKQQTDGSLQIVEGPGTAFAKSVLDADNVPKSVQDSLLVYNDE